MVCGACAARINARACSSVLIAELAQIVPRVDARRVAVAPLDLHGVATHLVHPLRLHVGLHLLVANDALSAPLLHALRAGTACAQPSRRKLRFSPIVPADEQVPLRIEGEIGGLGLRGLWLELVEEAHAGLVTRSAGMQRAMLRS